MRNQLFDHDGVSVEFIDKKQNHHKSKCQPRDIKIVTAGVPDLREEIAIDIRRHQGFSDIGIAKGLLFN